MYIQYFTKTITVLCLASTIGFAQPYVANNANSGYFVRVTQESPAPSSSIPTPTFADLAPTGNSTLSVSAPAMGTQSQVMPAGFSAGCGENCDTSSQHWQSYCQGDITGFDSAVQPANCVSCDSSGLFGSPCDAGCIGACGDGSCQGQCGVWAHYTSAYASFIYMRPRDAQIAYAVPIDGPIAQAPAANPIQIAGVGVVEPEFEPAFNVGFNLALNSMSSLDINYTMFESSTMDQIETSAPNVMRSIVSHPSSTSTATDFLTASANLDIDYDVLDLTFRHLFVGGRVFAVNYFLGARYGTLDQQFRAHFVDNGTEDVQTTIDFEGAGLRFGLDAERHACRSRLRYYAKASASFIAGRFRTNYFQGTSFDPTIVDTNWEAGRVVPILDFEIGAGWRSANDRLRLSAGYMVSSWYNMVKTDDFIWAVQQNNFLEMHESITFDGLVGRVEYRF